MIITKHDLDKIGENFEKKLDEKSKSLLSKNEFFTMTNQIMKELKIIRTV
ncbi:MAG: hypothetical protein ABH807_00615 [Candidatus Shapirobacteria bacterium]